MTDKIAASIALTAVNAVMLGVIVLITLFSGNPDYMDAVICEKLGASPKQCAALISYNSAADTLTSTTTSTTTRKHGVE